MSSGSISCSFIRRMASTMSQLEASLGCPLKRVVSSKISAMCLELVRSLASYSGRPYSSMYLAIFSVRSSGWRAFTRAIHSSLMTTGARSGSGKYL